jgi:CheY-like chemotaxis protein
MKGVASGPPRHGDEWRLTLLLADDDARARSLLGALARERVDGLAVLEAWDGAEAIQIGLRQHPQIALLAVGMPGVGGIEAALTLRALRPQIRLALGSEQPLVDRGRAREHRLPLFDLRDTDDAIAWLELQAQTWLAVRARRKFAERLSLECTVCGYGVSRHAPPARCPMCQTESRWLRREQPVFEQVAVAPD